VRFSEKPDTTEISELAAAREHLIPNFYTLSFAQIKVSDRTKNIRWRNWPAQANRGSRACLLIARNRNPQSANAGRRAPGWAYPV